MLCLPPDQKQPRYKPPDLPVGSLPSIFQLFNPKSKISNPKSIHSPRYAKLKVKAFLNCTQTSSKIYELFNRSFGNHAVFISTNLSSSDDF